MNKNMKKISLVFVVLLVLIISLLVIIKNKKPEIKDNSTQQDEIMKTKEILQGSGMYFFDSSSSKISWEGKKTIVKEWIDNGSISIQSGDITLVDNNVTEGKIVIDMNSITTNKTGAGGGEDNLSKHLKSADFFGVEVFPTSQFKLNSLIPTETVYTYTAKGEMTIKNITKDIEFPVTIYMENGLISMNAEIVLDRTQFDVRFGSTNFFNDIGDKAIDNDFTLKLELVAKKQ
jgi:polyisoprenoid-binding protein YceI